MPQFNPYHFIPVEKGDKTDPLAWPVDALPDHVRHDRYLRGTYSGRMLCRLTTETPTFVGARKDESALNDLTIPPFELEGRPAVPASTLRGCIGALVEAASGSALRILNDQRLSYRQPREECLSAIGMVVEKSDAESGWAILPLVPPFGLDGSLAGGGAGSTERRAAFVKMFPQPTFRIYLGNATSIRDPNFGFSTFLPATPFFHNVVLRRRRWGADPRKSILDPIDDELQLDEKGRLVLAQRIIRDDPEQGPETAAQEVAKDEIRMRCIARVLGCSDKQVPPGKEHELLVPFPQSAWEKWQRYPIPKDVLDRFYELADQRAKASEGDPVALPYVPRDTRPGRRGGEVLRLQEGDLVYFSPTRAFDGIEDFAFSSIWRGSAGSTHQFFAGIDRELLPFTREREWLTAGEALLGVVSEAAPADEALNDEDPPAMRALAGRVRFTHARDPRSSGDQDLRLPSVLLKVLDSPKPPCPALYFKGIHGGQQFIPKPQLAPGQSLPHGRKQYLHHDPANQPWKAKTDPPLHPKMQRRVAPLATGVSFTFAVDFDNLSAFELGMLCFALRPQPAFRHKIGMGRSIGLGTIRIDPMAIFTVSRSDRYSAVGFGTTRFDRGWIDTGVRPDDVPDRFGDIRQAITTPPQNAEMSFAQLREGFETVARRRNEQAHHALLLLGTLTNLRDVHVPIRNGGDVETNTYAWFAENERTKGRKQALAPLDGLNQIPPLEPN